MLRPDTVLIFLPGIVFLPDNSSSISSNILPFVSGTRNTAYNEPKTMMPENMKNTMEGPSFCTKPGNVLVMTKVHDQFSAVTIEAAGPRTFAGRASPIKSQGMGPHPKEKAITYTMKLTSGSHEMLLIIASHHSASTWSLDRFSALACPQR